MRVGVGAGAGDKERAERGDRAGGEGRERAGAARLYLVILVGGDGDEVGLGEHVGAEGAVGQLEDVVGPDYVEPGLVLVHGVEDGLGGRESTARGCRQPHSPRYTRV